MRPVRNERGQALVLTVVFMTVLLGAAALAIDVGAWYQAQRHAQATADASALAGAQALPADPAQAQTLAAQYATDNGGGADALGAISLRSDFEANDTVVVKVQRTAPTFFASIFGLGHPTVDATASARAGVPEQVNGAAPIVVNKLHPMLSGPGCPCFHIDTTIPLGKDGAPGAFGMVNLDEGNNGVPNLASWIQYGFNGYLPLGLYDSDPGAKFNSNGVLAALQSRVGTELLFPVYDTLSGNGANAEYNVIGWVAFHLDCVGLATSTTDCVNQHGNNDSLTGYFTRVIWDGIQSSANKHLPDFGVYSVTLVN